MKLLAPAGNFEAFMTAINAGADEIYLGYGSFNARVKAGNFDKEWLTKAVKKAHLFGVKVCCTFNTLMKEEEIEIVYNAIKEAVECGVDALIIQDLGIVRMVRKYFKGVEIHASTQMGISNLDGAVIAGEMGACRVVLARESEIGVIRDIKQKTDLEVEYFGQGALCVAYSGNCYLSNTFTGKSGNRGLCQQLCRLPYTAEIGDKLYESAHYLSTYDLSMAKDIRRLKDAGVDSLKIEGRLRRPSYIARTLGVYRKLIDGEKFSQSMLVDLRLGFNRGDNYTSSYVDNGLSNVIYSKNPSHIGIQIGSVVSVEKFKDMFKVGLIVDTKLKMGDGIKFFDGDNEIASLGVGNTETDYNITYIFTKQKLKVGLLVRLTESEVELPNRKLDVKIEYEFLVNTRPYIKLITGNYSIELQGDSVLQPARNQPVSIPKICENLSKTSDTDFNIVDIIGMTDNIFIPISALNKLRRDALEKLEKTIIESNTPKIKILDFEQENVTKMQKNTINLIKNMPKVIKNEIYVYYPDDYSSQNIINLLMDFYHTHNTKAYLFMPMFLSRYDYNDLKRTLIDLGSEHVGILANNISHLEFTKLGYDVIGGEYLNIINSLAREQVLELGVKGVCMGYECDGELDYKINNKPNILAVLAHCPFMNISGSKCDKCAYNENAFLSLCDGRSVGVERYKLSRCYFKLIKK